MSDRPKVSVIVPMYNPGKMIQRGIESLRKQTLDEIEIILVNDASKEETLTEARAAAAEDARIKILDLEVNSGAGIARNVGIENASGEYLAFMDADDFMAPDFLQLLYRKATLYNADIAKGSLLHVSENGVLKGAQPSRGENGRIRGGLKKGQPLYTLFRFDHYSAIYSNEMIRNNQIRYGTSRYGEDNTFLLRATAYTRQIVLDDRAKYYLVDNPDSLMKQMTAERLAQQLLSLREQIRFLTDHFGENINLEYVLERVKWVLGVQAAAVRTGKLEKEAADFLEGIRAEVMGLPNLSVLSLYSPLVGALIEYHANLSSMVMRQLEAAREESVIIESIVRCFRFASSHPRRQDLYEGPLKESLDRGDAYFWGMGPYRAKAYKKRKRMAFLRRLWSELRTTVDPSFLANYTRKYLAPKKVFQEAKKVIKGVIKR